MLKCRELTISCICSNVGRLTVDMGPPSDVVAAAGAAVAEFRDRDTALAFGERAEGRAPFDGARAGPFARDAMETWLAAGCTTAPGAAGTARAAPSPTRSAIAPPRTAAALSSRV